jgi:hypothetical protein
MWDTESAPKWGVARVLLWELELEKAWEVKKAQRMVHDLVSPMEQAMVHDLVSPMEPEKEGSRVGC